MLKLTYGLLVLCLLAVQTRADELVIESFTSDGALTFNTVSNAIDYRVEWAPSLVTDWTNFAATAALDAISPTTNASITVAVPIFYRVVATIGSPYGNLVINEIDYDQVNADSNEFVEIHNKEAFPVAVTNYRLEFVNGVDSNVYLTVPLASAVPPIIGANGYLVIGNPLVVDALSGIPKITIANSSIQNGSTDGVRLVTLNGTFVDGIAYEGTVPGTGEGATAPTDNMSTNSLQRLPNGADTGNNATDFALSSPTPGVQNDLP